MSMDHNLQFGLENRHYRVSCDLDGDHCTWPRSALDRFSIPSLDTCGIQIWNRLLHPADYALMEPVLSGDKACIRGEFRFLAPDGSYRWIQCQFSRPDSQPGHSLLVDIWELPGFQPERPAMDLRSQSLFITALTGLAASQKPCVISLLGSDGCTGLSQLYSRTDGDEMVRHLAGLIRQHFPDNASIFQLESGCFGILCPGSSVDNVQECFLHCRLAAGTMDFSEGAPSPVSIFCGSCQTPGHGQDAETLLGNAQIAFQEALSAPKDPFVVYTETLSSAAKRQNLLAESIKDSVNHNFTGFELWYQPLILAENSLLSGCEVLLRFRHPGFPYKTEPAEFIPVLEKTRLIIPVGKWILDTAFWQCKEWNRSMPGFRMSVNISVLQFMEPGFQDFVMDLLAKHELEPRLITLELTESVKVSQVEELSRIFNFFRSQGIRIALDDFGTRYDSLQLLRSLSADELKIDHTFLEQITYNVTDQKILTQIINLCDSMDMDVCVEGIETHKMEQMGIHLGARLLQGYYFSPPIPADTFHSQFLVSYASPPAPKNHLLREGQSMVYSTPTPAHAMDLETLVENVHAGILQVGLDDNFTFLACNEGYRRMLGYTAKEMEEKFKNRALGFVHPGDAEYVNQEIRRQLGQGDTVTIEFRIVRSDGSPLWILGTGNVVRASHGTPNLVVVILDNDRIKKKNLENENSCIKFKRILDNLPTGIKSVRFDEDFTLEYISPGFLSLLGYEPEDIERNFQNKYVNMVVEEDRPHVILDVQNQLKKTDIVILRYRSTRKNDTPIWLETVTKLCPPNEDGIQRFYSSVINITDTMQDVADSRSLNFAARFQNAVKRWGDVLFEYNFHKKTIVFSEIYNTIFGRSCDQELQDELLNVYEEDRQLLSEALEQVRITHSTHSVEIRVKNRVGEFIWCSVTFNEPELEHGAAISVLGKITNIDAEKNERIQLMEKARQDSLTSLLNKTTTEGTICQILSQAKPNQFYALFMLDLDNFKWVNDNLGHLFGDKLLVEVADRLKSLFDGGDVLGRAGGDEFMVFFRFNGDTQILEQKAASILEAFRVPFSFEGKSHSIQISVGISYYPYDGCLFRDLFRKADSALYRVKLRNKNGYCIFSMGSNK